jgi:hypothetical protein
MKAMNRYTFSFAFVLCAFCALACSSRDDAFLRGSALDVRLSSLEVTLGSGSGAIGVELIAASDDENDPIPPAERAYQVFGVADRISITAKLVNPSARMTINGAAVRSGISMEFPNLGYGDNLFQILISVEAGSFSSDGEYEITYTKAAPDDSSLREIAFKGYTCELREAGSELPPSIVGILEPKFDPRITSYELNTPFRVEAISFIPLETATGDVNITVGGLNFDGKESEVFPINYASPRTIEIVVTRKTGSYSTTYTVKVTRKEPNREAVIESFHFDNLPGPMPSLRCSISDSDRAITGTLINLAGFEIYDDDETEITDLRPRLRPTVVFSEGATISPPVSEFRDFRNPVTYRVTSECGTEITAYTVTIGLSVPFPILALRDSAGRIHRGDVPVNVGALVRDEVRNLSFRIVNIGYAPLDLKYGGVIGTAWGWSGIDGAPTVATNAYHPITVTATPPTVGSLGTTLTLEYSSPTESGSPTRSATFTLNAVVRETPVNNLFITEWAEVGAVNAAGDYGTSANASAGYIELRNFSGSPILIDENIVLRSASGRRYVFDQYGAYSLGNRFGQYTRFAQEPLLLAPGASLIILPTHATPSFFNYAFTVPVPAHTICVRILQQAPSSGNLIRTGTTPVDGVLPNERLKRNDAWLERGTTQWGHTPDPSAVPSSSSAPSLAWTWGNDTTGRFMRMLLGGETVVIDRQPDVVPERNTFNPSVSAGDDRSTKDHLIWQSFSASFGTGIAAARPGVSRVGEAPVHDHDDDDE